MKLVYGEKFTAGTMELVYGAKVYCIMVQHAHRTFHGNFNSSNTLQKISR